MQVTLVGLPAGLSDTSVLDPETGARFEPGVTVEVDDPTVQERLKSVEQFGYAFLFDNAAALDAVTPDDVVPPPEVDPGAATAAPQ